MRAQAGERRARLRVERREQGDLDAARDQTFGEQARHEFPRAVVPGWGAPRDRPEHRDLYWARAQ